MATTEAAFKTEFRKDLLREYPDAHIWTNTDLVSSGLPDFSVLYRMVFMAVEAKFVKALPKKATSNVLSHTVSESQKNFLEKTRYHGHAGIVLIGTPDAAAVMTEIKTNYTLAECLSAPRILKVNGHWQVKGFIHEWK